MKRIWSLVLSIALLIGLVPGLGCQSSEPNEPIATTHLIGIHTRAAERLSDAGDHDAAVTELEKALAREPNSVAVHCLKGACLLRAGKPGEAEKAFVAAANLIGDKDSAADIRQVNLGLAEALAGLGRVNEADAAFERAARADPARSDEVVKVLRRLVGVVQTCGRCEGSGSSWNTRPSITCGICGGSGSTTRQYDFGGRIHTSITTCGGCGGLGNYDRSMPADLGRRPCSSCGGVGSLRVGEGGVPFRGAVDAAKTAKAESTRREDAAIKRMMNGEQNSVPLLPQLLEPKAQDRELLDGKPRY